MTDIYDEATEVEMRQRDAAIADQRAQIALEAARAAARIEARGDAPAICCDCEDPIPTARSKAVPGCLRCAHCERRHSQRMRANR